LKEDFVDHISRVKYIDKLGLPSASETQSQANVRREKLIFSKKN